MAAPRRAVVKVPPLNEFEICEEGSSFSQLDGWAENIEVTAFPLVTLIESNALPPQVDLPDAGGRQGGGSTRARAAIASIQVLEVIRQRMFPKGLLFWSSWVSK